MHRLLVLLALVAVGGAALLATTPRGTTERHHGWDGPLDDRSFTAELVVDAGAGIVTADGQRPGRFRAAADTAMRVVGTTGPGEVTITVIDPAGTPVIHDRVAPDTSIDLSVPVSTDVAVTLTADPPAVGAPGGEVTIELTLTLVGDAPDPVQLVWASTGSEWVGWAVGPEREAPGTNETLAVLSTPGPDGCASVLAAMPVRLEPGTPVSCRFAVTVSGSAGETAVGRVGLIVEEGDLEAEVPGSSIEVAIVERGTTAGTGPGPDPDDPAAPPPGAPDSAAHPALPPEPPLHALLVPGTEGRHTIVVDAPAGSAGFRLELAWWEPDPPVGPVLAGVWLVAGAAALLVGAAPLLGAEVRGRVGTGTVSGRAAPSRVRPRLVDRLAAATLATAGIGVVTALWWTAEREGPVVIGGGHAWLLGRGFVPLAGATLVLATAGTVLAGAGARPGWLCGVGRVLLAIGTLVAVAGLTLTLASLAFLAEAPTAYAGDYLGVAGSLTALGYAVPLLAAGAALHGTSRCPPDAGRRGRSRGWRGRVRG